MEKETNFLEIIKKGKQNNPSKTQTLQKANDQGTTAKQTSAPAQKNEPNRNPTANREKSINLANVKIQNPPSDNTKVNQQNEKQRDPPLKKQEPVPTATQNKPQPKTIIESSASNEVIHRKVPRESTNSQVKKSQAGPKYTIQRKLKKEDSTDLIINFLIIGVGVVAILTAVIYYFDLPNSLFQLPFCDVNQTSTKDKCAECPAFGICEDGKLKECIGGYVMSSDKRDCITNRELQNFARNAYELGAHRCDSTVRTVFTESDVREALIQKYPQKKQLIEDNFYTIVSDWSLYASKYNVISKNGAYSSNKEKIPIICKAQLLIQDYWLILICITAILAFMGRKIRTFRRNRWYKRCAKKIYQSVYDSLKAQGATCVRVLYEQYKKDYNLKDYERIWKYVEDYRLSEGEIYWYEDTYREVFEKFWVLEDNLVYD